MRKVIGGILVPCDNEVIGLQSK